MKFPVSAMKLYKNKSLNNLFFITKAILLIHCLLLTIPLQTHCWIEKRQSSCNLCVLFQSNKSEMDNQ